MKPDIKDLAVCSGFDVVRERLELCPGAESDSNGGACRTRDVVDEDWLQSGAISASSKHRRDSSALT